MPYKKPIAIVTGGGGYNDMGLVRSCGEGGMDVVLITPKKIIIPINKSKYVIEWIPTDVHNEVSFINALTETLKKYANRITCLFPASDQAAFFIDKHYKQLNNATAVPHACGQLGFLMDKLVMTQIASECAMIVPESKQFNLNIHSYPSFPIPCIIKPLRSIYGEKGDITICHNQEIFEGAINMYRTKGFYDIIIQEFIKSSDIEEIAVTGINTGDNTVIGGTIQKKRIRGNGSTVYGVVSPEIPPKLKTNIESFIHKTSFNGIFDIEFLKSGNKYYFIECNFRNGAYGYAMTKAGFNMPIHFLLHSINGTDTRRINISKIKFMEERSDLLNVIEHNISAIRWLRDLLTTNVFLWWNWKDPKPMLRIPHFIKNKIFKR